MITVGEAAAGPAQIRGADALHVIDELLADPVHIWNFGITPDPDAVIDNTAEMLDEMPIDLWVDHRAGLIRCNFDFSITGRNEPRSSPNAESGAG